MMTKLKGSVELVLVAKTLPLEGPYIYIRPKQGWRLELLATAGTHGSTASSC